MQKRHRLTGNDALNKMICTQIALEPGGYPCIGKPYLARSNTGLTSAYFTASFVTGTGTLLQ